MTEQNVLVYVSDDCNECVEMMAFLDKYHVEYQVRNISNNQEYMRELQREKIYATPVAFVNKERVLGFQKNKLMSVIGLPKYL
ncbi:glutaredoxin family protein [Aquibacillus kalidii]|uniref:glutaredoxin family protein n=1 Tax=Aquibacillus kalidii TaxID=2762597 RepID=UPI0016492817|nr:glutaredoxin domain-containing protein [Aquibacillus kalidii]